MLRRSWKLLSSLAANSGFAAFQKKVEEGQSKSLLPSQRQKLKVFYDASQAVAHLPSVLDVARALVYDGYTSKKGLTTNQSNRSRSNSDRSSGTGRRRSTSRIRTTRRSASSSNRNSADRKGQRDARQVATRKDRSQPQKSRKSLSVKKEHTPSKTLESDSTSLSSSSLSNAAASHALQKNAVGSGATRTTHIAKRAKKGPVSKRGVSSKSTPLSKTSTPSSHSKVTKKPSPKALKQKKKPLTPEEKLARRRFSKFRKAVLKWSGLKSSPKLDERISQLWHLLRKKRVKPEKHVSVAIRVLKPNALRKMQKLKHTWRPATSLSLRKKNNGGRYLGTSPLSAHSLAKPASLLRMTSKEIEKRKFIKFRDTVIAKTGGTLSSAVHLRRIRELWNILLGKPIKLQERISIAIRVLGPEEKRHSAAGISKRKKDSKEGRPHTLSGQKKEKPHSSSFSLAGPRGVSSRNKSGIVPSMVWTGRKTGLRSFSLGKSTTSAKKSGAFHSLSSVTPLMSKKKRERAEFDAFRRAVLSSANVTRQQQPKIEKALRGLWRILLKRNISFDQRVSVATRMLIESLKQLQRSTLLTQHLKEGGKGSQGQRKGTSKKKIVEDQSIEWEAGNYPSFTPMEGALPRPPGGMTIATSSGAVSTLPWHRSGAGGALGSHAAGSSNSAGGGKQAFARRPLSKKQLDFLAFYRAMLMTGHISREPTERSKTIKYLWGNTRHLKNLEARIKLSEAHLAGAIQFPLVPTEATGSGGSVSGITTTTANANNTSVGCGGTGAPTATLGKPLRTA